MNTTDARVYVTRKSVRVGASYLFTFDIAGRKGSFDRGQRHRPDRVRSKPDPI